MKSLVLLLVTVLVSLASAQYQPSNATRIEVNEAANFTDGIVVDCNDTVLGGTELLRGLSGDYVLCVDVSMTPWEQDDLMRWSTYGLSAWRTIDAWKRVSDIGLTHMKYNPARSEGLLIMIVSNRLVVYIVMDAAQ